MEKEIRWTTHFESFKKSLARLDILVRNRPKPPIVGRQRQQLLDSFNETYDLAIKTLRQLLQERNRPNSDGLEHDLLGQAIDEGFITDAGQWSACLQARTWPTDDEPMMNRITGSIVTGFIKLLQKLEARLEEEKTGLNGHI